MENYTPIFIAGKVVARQFVQINLSSSFKTFLKSLAVEFLSLKTLVP